MNIRLLSVLLMAIFFSYAVCGQSPDQLASVEQRLSAVESRIQSQESLINQLQTKIDEVTNQNLALKHAISLHPTIAEYTAENGLNFRLLEATGNSQKGEITLIISVYNPTKHDIFVRFINGPQMVDELGYSYNMYTEQVKATIGNEGVCSGANCMPDTPITMELVYKTNGEPQYIKSFYFKGMSSFYKTDFRFINIPIKWD